MASTQLLPIPQCEVLLFLFKVWLTKLGSYECLKRNVSGLNSLPKIILKCNLVDFGLVYNRVVSKRAKHI